MPKKSESVRESKSHPEHFPKKDHDHEPGKASYDNGNRQKKNDGMKPTGRNKNPFGDIGKPVGGTGSSTGNDDNVFDGLGKLSGSGKKSKSGCFPKLFMLLLSMVAGAAYFFLNS